MKTRVTTVRRGSSALSYRLVKYTTHVHEAGMLIQLNTLVSLNHVNDPISQYITRSNLTQNSLR